MIYFQQFYLDREKDIAVELYLDGERMEYLIRTPNHHTGNLISNLALLCGLETGTDDRGLKVIRGEVPCYFDGDNRRMYILRLGNTKVANIFPDGRVEMKASIPAISKTLMSQTKDYRLGIEKTIVKTYIRSECKFRTDLHTHMNGNLPPDALIALGIVHQIRYPYYYIKKLDLSCTASQREKLEKERIKAEAELGDIPLSGRHRDRRIDDHTFINFADLILGNLPDAAENIQKIRNSLTIPKDGQAVFADLEKVYLYRYVFTRGSSAAERFSGLNLEGIPDREVRAYALRMRRDRDDDRYCRNTLYQDLLLWIAREYRRYGIEYAEISDTSLLNRTEAPDRLRQIHEIMPAVTRETGVLLRFLAGIRRVPLTIIRDRVTPNDYLAENLRCLRAIAGDPYVAGSDIIGEEINDILEIRSVIRELTAIAALHPGFVIRIHAGENDSLRDNVANSIRCVAEALDPDQAVPSLRIGHGLYTCDLRSARGKKLLEDMRRFHVTLEFQITSNVRLNNLSYLDRHPLRQYLQAGICCVQGTDGSALYGTNSIDEELSLEKLLGLTAEELRQMRKTEDGILEESRRIFERKSGDFRAVCPGGDTQRFYRRMLEGETYPVPLLWQKGSRVSAEEGLADQLSDMVTGRIPVVVCGGSFNSNRRHTEIRAGDRALLDWMTENADPQKVVFAVGHRLTGQEGYLARKAADAGFGVYAIVPRLITAAERYRLRQLGIKVVLSIENDGMGLYKSFAYEIFRRMPSVLLAFDGNSAALNLIQEARNGHEKCRIFISTRSRGLAAKAKLLEGYVRPIMDAETILKDLLR
ncbi:MAG: adenosine deaminase [Clostridia bacterium]|nr:adenosine deaminase [Clostridia bacterium]